MMIAFHNKVVKDDDLLSQFGADLTSGASRFRAAARIVRWHYQWVVVNDYLDRICEPGMVTEVLNTGGTPRLVTLSETESTVPLHAGRVLRRRLPSWPFDGAAKLFVEQNRCRTQRASIRQSLALLTFSRETKRPKS